MAENAPRGLLKRLVILFISLSQELPQVSNDSYVNYAVKKNA